VHSSPLFIVSIARAAALYFEGNGPCNHQTSEDKKEGGF